MNYKLDIIFLFNKEELKNKTKIDSRMSRFRKRIRTKYDTGIIWGFGNHYDKSRKNGVTWFVCFSNDESVKNQMVFYTTDFKDIMADFKAKVIDNLIVKK